MHAHSSSYSSQPNANPDQMGAFQDYFPLVRSLAKKIHSCLPRTVDFDDLYSAGLAGLWQAYTRFDSSRKAKFSTYANFRVRGAILDSLRIGDWAPRALRSKGRELQAAIRTLTARLGYRPTEDEVADEMKIGLSEYQQLRSSLDGLEVGSLYRMSDDGSDEEVLTHVQTDPADDPLVRYLQTEIKTRLTDTIEDLPERERVVATLYYYEELTQHEIALALGISEGRVCQIHASAVSRLRSALPDMSQNVVKLRKVKHSESEKPATTPWLWNAVKEAA